MNPSAILPAVSFVAEVALAAAILARPHRSASDRAFLGFIVPAALWAFFEWMERLAVDLRTVVLCKDLASSVWPFAVCGLAVFLLSYVGSPLGRSRLALALLYLMAAAAAAIDGLVLRGGDLQRTRWGWSADLTPAQETLRAVVDGWGGLMALSAVALVVVSWLRATPGPARRQARLLVVAVVPVTLTGVISEVVLPSIVDGFSAVVPPLTTSVLFVCAATLMYAMRSAGFLEPTPAAAAEDILATMTEAVLLLNRGGRILHRNAAAERMLGGVAAILHSTVPGLGDLLARVERTGQPAERRLSLAAAVGAPRDIAVTVAPHAPRRELAGFIVVMRDVTEEAKAAVEHEELARLQLAERMSAGVAQQYNSALTVVQSSAELIGLRAAADTATRQAAERILAAVRSVAAVASALHPLSAARGADPVVKDLGSIVEECLPVLRSLAPPSVEISLVSPGAPVPVRADCAQLELVLCNLTANSADAMPRGGRITIEWRASEGGGALLRFRDNGRGMDQATARLAFEPYFSTTADLRRGLGLPVVAAIVRRHGGTVSLSSAPDQGTEVSMSFPLADPSTSFPGPMTGSRS